MTGTLSQGDLVQFLDSKGRKYPVVLEPGKEFHSHSGFVPHDDVIGLPEGSKVHTGRGQAYVVMRPTLSEFILKMPRGAQVIYPKDIGPILMMADIGPGVRVLESGVGSGALSMGMLRAGADIVGYELREDFANRARANVEQFLGPAALDRYQVELRDCYDGIDAEDIDRVVLDLPVNSASERGLLSIALHPDFPATPATGSRSRRSAAAPRRRLGAAPRRRSGRGPRRAARSPARRSRPSGSGAPRVSLRRRSTPRSGA